MTATPTDVVERSRDLVDEYSTMLDAWVNERVPTVLTNSEYAARCSALMIALNRQLARCAAAFGEAHEIDAAVISTLVHGQLDRNLQICTDALSGAGMTAQ